MPKTLLEKIVFTVVMAAIMVPPSLQSPGAKFGSSCAEFFHKRPCGPSRLRREAVSVVCLYEQYSFFVIS